MNTITHSLNGICDRFIRLNIQIGRRSYSAFQVWGCAALIFAALLGLVLGLRRDLPLRALAVVVALALLTFFVTALVTKIIAGDESLTFYHQLVAITGPVTVTAWLMRQPVLLVTDITVVAVGATLTFGRIGCLLVGCCHGRPCRFGIRYGAEHAAAGFTRQMVGVRLFPIQVVEFLFAVVITPIGFLMIWDDWVPGAATAWWIATYCSTRFFFELARWPPNYHFKSGLSQYQWISVALLVFSVSLELVGVLPFHLWHVLALGAVLLATAVLIIERRLRSPARLLTHPEHVREIAAVIDSVRATSGVAGSEKKSTPIPVRRTSLGVQVSAGEIIWRSRDVYHYAFSSKSRVLTPEIVRSMSNRIPNLNHDGRTEVLSGSNGVIHLLIHPSETL